MEALKRFIRDEEGLAMAEYALLLALIAVAVSTAVIAFRGKIAEKFTKATTELGKQ